MKKLAKKIANELISHNAGDNVLEMIRGNNSNYEVGGEARAVAEFILANKLDEDWHYTTLAEDEIRACHDNSDMLADADLDTTHWVAYEHEIDNGQSSYVVAYYWVKPDRQIKADASKAEYARVYNNMSLPPRNIVAECSDGTWQRDAWSAPGRFGWGKWHKVN